MNQTTHPIPDPPGTLENAPPDQLGRATVATIARRLLPFLFLLYVVAYLDRVNVSFAAVNLRADLHISEAMDGFAKGVFFIGYFLFEVPSNLMLRRVGARVWISRIMVTWGIISVAMIFMRGPVSFCLLRFALGLAEAGFFPGIILYLTDWFPAKQRARAVAVFMTATAVAGVVGGPLSGSLLQLNGVRGLHGWQWMFLLEGAEPAVLLGIAVFFLLPNSPDDVAWLSPESRAWLKAELARDHATGEQASAAAAKTSGHHHPADLARALSSGRVWHLCGVYFTISLGLYCASLWMPDLVRAAFPGRGPWRIGLIVAIPYAVAAAGMVLIGASSDRTDERRGHVAASLLLGAAGAASAATLTLLARGHPLLQIAAFSVASLGIWGSMGPFWSLPPQFLRGAAAAGGIALVNSVGNLGGFLGPYLFGYLKGRYGNFAAAPFGLAVFLAAGAAAVIIRPRVDRV